LVPSAEDATAYHPNPFVGVLAVIQLTPELVDMRTPPAWNSKPQTAINLVPSAELATPCHALEPPNASQVPPAFVDVYICPTFTTATNLMPSAEQAMADQLAAGAAVCAQAIPQFVET
jgi:hypothetical protein